MSGDCCYVAHSRAGEDVSSGVLATLLTELDGVESADGVCVVAATNRPEKLDPALLRPGRLEIHVYVPRPNFVARCDVLSLHLRRLRCEPAVFAYIEVLSTKTEGWNGAELENLCREAAMTSLREHFGCDARLEEPTVSVAHILRAFSSLTGGISTAHAACSQL
jgi:SpoVK/Ycf46/Vps4 family AAA+-type ATPase